MADNILSPYYQSYSVGGFVAESLVRLLDETTTNLIAPFNSLLLKRLIKLRRGFTLNLRNLKEEEPINEEAKFIGGILTKLAQRGFPAPCSLSLENFLLDEGKKINLFEFKKEEIVGTYTFKIISKNKKLAGLLKTCFFPELLLDKKDIELLLEKYKSLCTDTEKEFFELFCTYLPHPALALFLIPQRPIRMMISFTKRFTTEIGEQRVDFALELPFLKEDKWLQIAIEIDDPSHLEESQRKLDEERDKILKINGWDIYRFSTSKKQEWKEKIKEIGERLKTVIDEEIIKSAEEFKNLERKEQNILKNLVFLPIAEAQLMVIVGYWLYRKGNAEIRINNPQMINLKPILESINEYLTNLENLYGLKNLGRPKIVKKKEEADIIYFLFPSSDAWECLESEPSKVIMPLFVFNNYREPLLKNIFPRPIISEDPKYNEDILEFFLQNIFRKINFWEGQKELITKILKLKNVVGILSTAGGKSLCYQMASLLQPGFTVVIQPLRALMFDQIENLNAIGIHNTSAIMSHGEVTPEEESGYKEEGYSAIQQGFNYFVFISPERFQIPEFQKQVKQFVEFYPIPFCVVDEAHCISEWGHDFRPSYLNLGKRIPELCAYKERYIPKFIALTGTASQNVIIDICRELNILEKSDKIIGEDFDRKELKFEIVKVENKDRLITLFNKFKELIDYQPGQPVKDISGLIFTYFVKKKDLGVIYISKELQKNFPNVEMDIYVGEKPPGFVSPVKWEDHKIKTQKKFKRDEIKVLCCTHAFGMGIDKPNIRFIIHYLLPRSLEEHYQQAGRGGRDRKDCKCIIIFSDPHPKLTDEILNYKDIEKIKREVKKMDKNSDKSDIEINLWFLYNNFKGKEKEKRVLNYVWDEFISKKFPEHEKDEINIEISFFSLPDEILKDSNKEILLFPNEIKKEANYKNIEDKEKLLEKIIYRLSILGVVKDYTKDWGSKKFDLILVHLPLEEIDKNFRDYLKRYLTSIEYYKLKEKPIDYEEAVKKYAEKIIEFIYDYIVGRRIEAMKSILLAVREGSKNPEKYREILISYMGEKEFTQLIGKLLDEEKREGRLDYQKWFNDILKKAKEKPRLMLLEMACQRRLGEIKHPMLEILLGFSRLYYPDIYSYSLGYIKTGFRTLKEMYPEVRRDEVFNELIKHVEKLLPEKLDEVLEAVLEEDDSIEIARLCYQYATTPYNKPYVKGFFIIAKNILNVLNEKLSQRS